MRCHLAGLTALLLATLGFGQALRAQTRLVPSLEAPPAAATATAREVAPEAPLRDPGRNRAGPTNRHLPLQRGSLDTPLAQLPDEAWNYATARHLLNRAGFGGSHADVRALQAMGLEGALDHLLNYEPHPKTSGFAAKFPSRPDYRALREATREVRMKVNADYRRANDKVMRDLRRWWLRRMAETKRPLEEKMTFFWHGHFTSGYRDVRNALHMTQQNDLFREHAVGNFAELVHAVAKDAAMLEYLDNNRNRREKPNENFAREVLELFTLGVGHYSEQDIVEAARAFTGWNFNGDSGAYTFQANQHDYGLKTFMGNKGRFDGEDIIGIVLKRDRVSEYLVERLQNFFCERPLSEVSQRALAAKFRGEHRAEERYELKPVLRALFASAEFYASVGVEGRIKSPVELVVGAVRQLEIPPSRTAVLMDQASTQCGQQLFQPPNVKGWAGGRDWISTSALYDRYNFAGVITRDLDARSFGRKPKAKPRGKKAPSRPQVKRPATSAPTSRPTSRPAATSRPAVTSRPAATARPAATSQPATTSRPKAATAPAPKKAPAPRRVSPAERMTRQRFPFDPVKLCRRARVKEAADIVDHFISLCLVLPPSPEARRALIDQLQERGPKARTFALDQKDAPRRLRGMLHLLFASPEYQLN